jgi:predicted nucleic-acid-binding protein
MRLTADTNILIRAAVRDDQKQADAAAKLLKNARSIAVASSCLCEFVWVLDRVYDFGREEIAAAIIALVDSANVVVNRAAVEAGLAVLNAGGDFADGVIAHEGRWLGGEVFISFDKRAVNRVERSGLQARLLS